MLKCTWFILSLITLTLYSYGGSWRGVLFVKPKKSNVRRIGSKLEVYGGHALPHKARRMIFTKCPTLDCLFCKIIFIASFSHSFLTVIFNFR